MIRDDVSSAAAALLGSSHEGANDNNAPVRRPQRNIGGFSSSQSSPSELIPYDAQTGMVIIKEVRSGDTAAHRPGPRSLKNALASLAAPPASNGSGFQQQQSLSETSRADSAAAKSASQPSESTASASKLPKPNLKLVKHARDTEFSVPPAAQHHVLHNGYELLSVERDIKRYSLRSVDGINKCLSGYDESTYYFRRAGALEESLFRRWQSHPHELEAAKADFLLPTNKRGEKRGRSNEDEAFNISSAPLSAAALLGGEAENPVALEADTSGRTAPRTLHSTWLQRDFIVRYVLPIDRATQKPREGAPHAEYDARKAVVTYVDKVSREAVLDLLSDDSDRASTGRKTGITITASWDNLETVLPKRGSKGILCSGTHKGAMAEIVGRAVMATPDAPARYSVKIDGNDTIAVEPDEVCSYYS